MRVALWGIDTQEVPRAFVERLERCGVLDGQMPIVELLDAFSEAGIQDPA